MTADSEGSGTAAIPFPAAPTEYIRAGAQWFSDSVRHVAEEQHPILKSFARRTVTEFPDPEDSDIDAQQSADYRWFSHQHDIVVSLETTLNFDIGTMLAHLDSLAHSLGSQQEKNMVQMIVDSATASGNLITIDLQDPAEQYIAALARMEILFDDEGHHGPLVIDGIELEDHMRKHPPSAEQQERIDTILRAKKEERDAPRRNRRLS